MFVPERFLSTVIEKYRKHQVSSETMALGIHKPASFKSILSSPFPSMRKALLKELYSISRIELEALITVFLVKRTSVN
jgi:hypothetical protein